MSQKSLTVTGHSDIICIHKHVSFFAKRYTSDRSYQVIGDGVNGQEVEVRVWQWQQRERRQEEEWLMVKELLQVKLVEVEVRVMKGHAV